MNKTEFVEAVATEAGTTKKDAESVINAFTKVVTAALTNGDKIQLIGFGTFEVADRAARTGRNPKTGEPVEVPASKTPKFKASGALKDAVNA